MNTAKHQHCTKHTMTKHLPLPTNKRDCCSFTNYGIILTLFLLLLDKDYWCAQRITLNFWQQPNQRKDLFFWSFSKLRNMSPNFINDSSWHLLSETAFCFPRYASSILQQIIDSALFANECVLDGHWQVGIDGL